MRSRISVFLSIVLVFGILTACNSSTKDKDVLVLIQTNYGDIKIKLSNETPLHRDNFVSLVKSGFYDSILFHRVINEFMIQAGDPSTKMEMNEETAAKYLYQIPAEINDSLFHKKGVIAAARQGDQVNPQRESSGTQFYIVVGKTFSDEELDNIEKRVNADLKQAVFYKHLIAERNRVEESGENKTAAEIQEFASMVAFDEIEEMKQYVIPADRRAVYRTTGGTPHLDSQYTVFGEVILGQGIVDSIASVQTGPRDRPIKDVIIIKAKVVKK